MSAELWGGEDEVALFERADKADDIYCGFIDVALEVLHLEFLSRFRTEFPKLGFSAEGWKLLGERRRIIDGLFESSKISGRDRLHELSWEYTQLSDEELEGVFAKYKDGLIQGDK